MYMVRAMQTCDRVCGGVVQDAGGQGVGFLLGSLGVTVALTSEACYKGLPKTQAGEVITFRGKPVLNTDVILATCTNYFV